MSFYENEINFYYNKNFNNLNNNQESNQNLNNNNFNNNIDNENNKTYYNSNNNEVSLNEDPLIIIEKSLKDLISSIYKLEFIYLNQNINIKLLDNIDIKIENISKDNKLKTKIFDEQKLKNEIKFFSKDKNINEINLNNPLKNINEKIDINLINNDIGKNEKYFILIEKIKNCKDCKLYQNRNKVVPGSGNIITNIMFIGEGPGEEEDISGIPFVGKAGRLLTKIMNEIGFEREKVYITNVVKCRPPGNRNPEKDEIISCNKYLIQQIMLIEPKLIVSLGKISANTLLKVQKNISEIRGKFIKLSYFKELKEVPIFFATYHPSAILRNPNLLNDFKNDLYKVFLFSKKNNWF
jgi:DNA polymerase